ncbi:MAG: HAD hydrolase family protein [Pyrinomonadaceae bacterium]
MNTNDQDVLNRAARIRFLALDCDGVLTDGKIYIGAEGELMKAFHVHDGQGIVRWIMSGRHCAIITARRSDILEFRAKELGIPILRQGVSDKAGMLDELAKELGVEVSEIAYLGDDLGDLSAMKLAGLPVAVANAVPEVKQAASLLTNKNGGDGAVRELIDFLLSAS